MPFYVSSRWRMRWAVWVLFIAEFAFTIPALALFAIAQPNLYRTKLRREGNLHGWNSSPLQQVYAAANRQDVPTPLVWSQYITDYNVVISVLSMFILLVKVILFIMHWFVPTVGIVVHGIVVGLWAYSLHAQTAPDMSDKRYPQPGAPWYITKGCGITKVDNPGITGYCRQAQAALAVTVFMVFVFAANTLLAIYSLIPTRAQRLARATAVSESEGDEDDGMRFAPPPAGKGNAIWELHQYPKSPAKVEEAQKSPLPRFMSPMTPRTVAYNKLSTNAGKGNGLPLRNA